MILSRAQLPAHSPLSVRAILRALGRGDPRATLAAAIRAERNVADVLLTSSGTAALTLALRAALRRRPGEPTLLPAYACYDLVTAAVGAASRVRFYDVDPHTLAPNLDSLSVAAQDGAAAIVVAHLFGVPVVMTDIQEIARRADALLIDDAAQATGASMFGAPLGGAGDMGVLSFGRGKGETGGAGGALLIRDAATELDALHADVGAADAVGVGFAARLLAQWLLGRPSLYGVPSSIPSLRLGETVYRAPRQPAAMAAGSARVLQVTRGLVDEEASVRRQTAARLSAVVGHHPDAAIVTAPEALSGWLRFPVLLGAHMAPALVAAGHRLGVRRGYPRVLSELEAARPLMDFTGPLPGAQQLARELHTLPTHSLLRAKDIHALEHWLSSALSGGTPRGTAQA